VIVLLLVNDRLLKVDGFILPLPVFSWLLVLPSFYMFYIFDVKYA
jgi:hypothetical protein